MSPMADPARATSPQLLRCRVATLGALDVKAKALFPQT